MELRIMIFYKFDTKTKYRRISVYHITHTLHQKYIIERNIF